MKKKLNKDKLWHWVWIISMYLTLIGIFYLVVQYKVEWEGRDNSKYLYFYNCSDSLCTTTEKVYEDYSYIKCNGKICPFVKEKQDNLVIVGNRESDYVFDYLKGEIINEKYKTYNFAGNNYIVMNDDGKYGIINREGEVVEKLEYGKITSYKDGFITYVENNKTGIKNISKEIDVKPIYEDVILINDSLYAYLEEGKYYIASYDTELPINNINYDYIYAIDNNNIMIINDNKLDIVDSNLKSILILKLDTYYAYQTEKERASLNLIKDNTVLRFTIIQDETNSLNYIYDIKNRKLYD